MATAYLSTFLFLHGIYCLHTGPQKPRAWLCISTAGGAGFATSLCSAQPVVSKSIRPGYMPRLHSPKKLLGLPPQWAQVAQQRTGRGFSLILPPRKIKRRENNGNRKDKPEHRVAVHQSILPL